MPNRTAWGRAHAKRAKLQQVTQPVTVADAALLRSWRERGTLWEAPDAIPDDWYWMYGALLGGAGVRVLTNDEMRDHVCGMALGPCRIPGNDAVLSRAFERWRARHVVRFTFSHGVTPGGDRPTLHRDPLHEYSREMQVAEHGWHIPSRAAGEGDADGRVERGSPSATAANANANSEAHGEESGPSSSMANDVWLCVVGQ